MSSGKILGSAALAVAFGSAFACSATGPASTPRDHGGANAGTPSAGGSGGSGQSGGGGGLPTSGGVGSGGAGSGGTLPVAGTGGQSGAAGSSGGSGGSGGTPAGGAGSGSGTGGSAGGGAGTSGTTPSMGCGTQNPPTGDLDVNGADYFVSLPSGYAASTPVPLVFGFHGRNRSHINFKDVDASNIKTELGSVAIMAYLKSQGGTGWEEAAEREPNVDFFEAVLERMLAGYCIDTSRIFAVGHSSGAHFTHIVACRFGETLRGIGAVAGYLPEQNCAGEVAAMVIHGATDNQVQNSSGRQARDFYLDRNGCDSTTLPGSVSPCVSYQGCDAGLPVEWCQHTEPTYENTNHGWPSFASEAIAGMFWGL